MLTFVFLIFIAMFAIGGIVISVLARRRKDGSAQRPARTLTDEPATGRATGGGDD